MTCRCNNRSDHRRGISLIEVLISIFVMAVGLLGVLSLMPLAHHEANRGMIEDRKGQVGRAALRDFRVRGMAAARTEMLLDANFAPVPDPSGQPIRTIVPVNWLAIDPSTGNPKRVVIAKTIPPNPFIPRLDERVFFSGQSFVIDPRMLATQGVAASVLLASKFPFQLLPEVANPLMERITLRPSALNYPVVMNGPGDPLLPMSLAQADHIFIAQDDLSIDRPDDGDLPPEQLFTIGTNGVGKRQSDGGFSWMATLVPELGGDAQYTLSIVVFYQRDSQMNVDQVNERRLVLDMFLSGGIGGGDIRLSSPAQELLDDVKAGQWLMLSQATPTEWRFRWYRILAAGDDPIPPGQDPHPLVSNSTDWGRYLTLSGGDWTVNPASPTNPQSPTFATIVNGVVAVYEKSIQLETSSFAVQ